jgi:hypothetical protein
VGIEVSSARGFALFAEQISLDVMEHTAAEVERLLERLQVSPYQLQQLGIQFRDMGMAGVDVQRASDAEFRKFGIDPGHVKANRALSRLLDATRKLNSRTPAGFIHFKVRA